jgi:energy-coupling factor transporter ATP-binding protein EcfA2
MRLEAVTVQRYRNFVDPQRIEIEPDVTCLVGKNESGKTTVLKALHRLKPANGSDVKFDLTTEYPRWRLASDRRKDKNLSVTEPIQAEFSLTADETDEFSKVFGLQLPEATRCHATRTYRDEPYVWLACTVAQATQVVANEVSIDEVDLSALPQQASLPDVVAAARKLAKEHRDSGEKVRATTVTAFANALEKYKGLTDGDIPDDEQVGALWERLPQFFYFSDYDTLPGETNLTELAAKIKSGSGISDKERTVVSLLAHAGETPDDFLDAQYDSRKAELQAVSSDLSRQVFKYWKQNPDLAVVFDTDNRVVATEPNGREVANRYLRIELRDGRHGDVETNFDTRSNGFQWFFSFFAAFSEYQDSDQAIIVLLDEPGTSLHGDAQHEFVDYIFSELGASKQTIYTTHSQHMVDPTRYEKLRAVHDRASRDNADLGVVVTLPNLSADRGTILPIESALGYSVSQHLFLGSGQHLALEGSSDYVYLLRMTEHNIANGLPGLDPRLAMIPIGGADNMPAFVALLGRRLKVSALIDGARSQARLSRIRSAAKDNGVPESAIVLCSDIPGTPTNADIEDLFTVADYLRLYNWAFSTNIRQGDLPTTTEPILKKLLDLHSGKDFDHALPAHQLTNRREEFFSSMETATAHNFAELFRLLNTTVRN